MVAPFVPLLALGGLGLLAQLTMKPARRGGQPYAPGPQPEPWVPPAAPPLPPPPSVVAAPVMPVAPALPPSPSMMAVPSPALPPSPPPVVSVPVAPPHQQVLSDVHDVLTAPVPPPPQPVAIAPAIVQPVAPLPAPQPVAPSVAPLPPMLPSVPPPQLAASPSVVFQPAPVPMQPSVPMTALPHEPTTTQTALPPPGFNPVAAKAQAARVVANLKKGRDNYSRPTLTAWQRLAGVAADGIYGGGSAGALAWYLQGTPDVAPRPFFKPTTVVPYPWAALAKAALPSGRTTP